MSFRREGIGRVGGIRLYAQSLKMLSSRMLLARLIGIVLFVLGSVLVLVGVTSHCSPNPVVSEPGWVPSCADTLVIAVFGIFLASAGSVIMAVELRSRRSDTTLKCLALAVEVSALALGATFAGLALTSIHQGFSIHEAKLFDVAPSCTGIDAVKGTTVTFHWWAASNITFGAWSCSTRWAIYLETGTSGSSSFLSQGGVYEFASACPPWASDCIGANVTGNYTRPLLEI